jgi:TAP-like protein
VFCSEWIPFFTQRQVLLAGERAFPSYPRSVLAQAPQLPYIYDDCRIWDVPPRPEAREMTRSAVPTLLLSGSFDAVTSLAWARSPSTLNKFIWRSANSGQGNYPGLHGSRPAREHLGLVAREVAASP